MNSEIKRLAMRVKFGGGDEELDLVQSAALRDLMNTYEFYIATLTAERDEARKEVDRVVFSCSEMEKCLDGISAERDQLKSDVREIFSDDWCLLEELKNLSRCDRLPPYDAAHRMLAIACCPETVEGK